jgi:hypothetical protein
MIYFKLSFLISFNFLLFSAFAQYPDIAKDVKQKSD